VKAYFSIGMALYSEGSYEDVFAQLTDGLSWSSEWASGHVVATVEVCTCAVRDYALTFADALAQEAKASVQSSIDVGDPIGTSQ